MESQMITVITNHPLGTMKIWTKVPNNSVDRSGDETRKCHTRAKEHISGSPYS